MFPNMRDSVLRICSQCFSLISHQSSCLACSQQRGFTVFTRQLSKPNSVQWLSRQSLASSKLLESQNKKSYCWDSGTRHFNCFPSLSGTANRLNLKSCSFTESLSSQVRAFSATPPPSPSKKRSTENSGKSPISWKTLIAVAGLGGVILIFMQQIRREKEREREKNRSRQTGKAKLGGDWELIDHHGNKRSSKDFRGQWILIYFGFTNCPDICPEEIEKIITVIDKTDANKDLPKIQPILITVDPERDTPEQLKEYLAEFSPRLLGFTGTREEIEVATRAFRVYFSAGPKDEDNDYIVDHSIISYLVNPEGEFVNYFGQNKTAEEMYNAIQLHIHKYKKGQK